MASVKCVVKVGSPAKASVSAQIQSTVKSRYSFEGQVICPISRLNIAQTGETVDLSHIVPKYLRNHYGRGVLDGADNIIPTFPAIHKQVELHQHRPLLSFEFLREDDDDYDLYHLLYSRTVGKDHVIWRYITHDLPVRLHRSSRSFLSIHHQVFVECEKISLATTSDLVKFREDLAQTHVRTAVTKNIVNAMITRQSRTLKAAGSSSRTVSENTLLAWIESESVYVSGSMWDYEELTEVPDQVVCRVLFHNKAQNTIDFICVDEYSQEEFKYFTSRYNPKASRVPKDLARFTVWKIDPCLFEKSVLEVVPKAEYSVDVNDSRDDGPIPVGSIMFNYLKPVGFQELHVSQYDRKTSLTKVLVGEQHAGHASDENAYELTCRQVLELARGEISSESLSEIRGRCFVVESPGGEKRIAKLVSVAFGCAEVHWLDRNERARTSRQESWVDDKYALVWVGSDSKKVVRDEMRSQSYRASISRIPFIWLHGMPFDLHGGRIPSSVAHVLSAAETHESIVKKRLLGVEVLRRFGGQDYRGVVTTVFPGDEPMYQVVYEDGDFEDMYLHELESCVEYRSKRLKMDHCAGSTVV